MPAWPMVRIKVASVLRPLPARKSRPEKGSLRGTFRLFRPRWLAFEFLDLGGGARDDHCGGVGAEHGDGLLAGRRDDGVYRVYRVLAAVVPGPASAECWIAGWPLGRSVRRI